MARPGGVVVGCTVRSVRPLGLPRSLGLILPTIPWAEVPGHDGTTEGETTDLTSGVTDRLQSLARSAEKAGATGLWACDHLFWHQPLLEPLSALSVAATATSTATLGTCVLQLPMRSPAAVARAAHTLQLLSGGRFVLGLGVGSHPGEYRAAGADYGGRGHRFDDGIEAIRGAWARTGDLSDRYR
ncbi:MAG: LLM class flavin-dependent oxidoreductase, partial [Acidimicrobiales bacterium]